ncbi:MAG: hypothetical protein R6U08_09190 [Bacillota bacterium]
MQENDTITAISTPLGEGGIGIVRLSGPKAFDIGHKIFIPSGKMNCDYPEAKYLYHGHVLNKKGETVDEVLVLRAVAIPPICHARAPPWCHESHTWPPASRIGPCGSR